MSKNTAVQVDQGLSLAERDASTVAKARKDKGSRLSAAEVRRLINTEDNLRNIQLLIARLEIAGTYQTVVDPHSGEIEERLIPPIDPAPVKAALDARFKLLNKVLPDLKSVEHTGEVQTGLSDLLKLAAERSAQHRSISAEREVAGEIVESPPERLTFL